MFKKQHSTIPFLSFQKTCEMAEITLFTDTFPQMQINQNALLILFLHFLCSAQQSKKDSVFKEHLKM